jgi:phage/plasmid-associated DNA primase
MLKKKIINDLLKIGVSQQNIQNKPEECLIVLNYYNILESYKKNTNETDLKELKKLTKNPDDIVSMLMLIANFNHKYLYDNGTKTWYSYALLHNYVWSPIDELTFFKELNDLMKSCFSYSVKKHISKQTFDAVVFLIKQEHLIDLRTKTNKRDYVFIDTPYHIDDTLENKRTFKKIENCGPQNYITTYSPIPWSPEQKELHEWEKNPIKKWLYTKIQNEEQVQVLRAICNITFHSLQLYNLEFFLEIYGPRASGKSTFLRLLEAIVSKNLVTSSSLTALDTNDFEKAKTAGKHLILLNEHDPYIGNSSYLKAATGGDLIYINPKYKDPYDIRNIGVIVITSNDPLIFDTSASAFIRRRISIKFGKSLDPQDFNTNLITFNKDGVDPKCEFFPHIPGFLNWVLSLTHKETIKIINNYLSKTSVNPDNSQFLWWIANNTVPMKDAEILINNDELGPSLYGQYTKYCTEAGLKPLSTLKFITNFEREFYSIFKYNVIEFKKNDKTGFRGVTYQTELRDHFENWRNAWKKECGENFFGENTVYNYPANKENLFKTTTRTEGETQEAILNLEHQMDLLIKQAHEGIYSLIGNPQKNDKPFNPEYNKKHIPGAGAVPKNEEDFFVKLSKEEHLIFYIKFLNEYFNPNEKNNITTAQLWEAYIRFLNEHKYKPVFTKNNIKNQTFIIWNKHFHQKIEKTNNIGPKSLKGLTGLQIIK